MVLKRRLRPDRRDLCPDRDPVRRLYAGTVPDRDPLRANGICNTLGRAATVVSPFMVGWLMANYKLPGVVWLMIGLVLIQIVVVWAWGVEPRNRGLEEVAAAKA